MPNDSHKYYKRLFIVAIIFIIIALNNQQNMGCVHDISQDTRSQIIALHNSTSKTYHQIASDVNVSLSSVSKIFKKVQGDRFC